MQIILSLFLISITVLLLAVVAGFIFFAIDLFFNELPYVATKKEKISTIMKLAAIKKGETVVDLGSGDGRLLFEAAKKGAYSIGYELNPYLVYLVKIRAKTRGLSHIIKVKKVNLWKADLKNADVVFVYGRKHTMKRFEDFIYKNCKKGTRVTVNSDKTITFPTKKPIRKENNVFLYKV